MNQLSHPRTVGDAALRGPTPNLDLATAASRTIRPSAVGGSDRNVLKHFRLDKLMQPSVSSRIVSAACAAVVTAAIVLFEMSLGHTMSAPSQERIAAPTMNPTPSATKTRPMNKGEDIGQPTASA